jgi:hypothetical protein
MDQETTAPIRDEHGNRLCVWCGSKVDQTGAGNRKRDYCRPSCRQRAYEERRHRRRVADALGLNVPGQRTDSASASPACPGEGRSYGGDVDAEEMRPWRPEDGPAPEVHTFAPGQRLLMSIRISGRWQACPVVARLTYGGRVAYQVEMQLPRDGGTSERIYWWNPATMRPLSPGRR